MIDMRPLHYDTQMTIPDLIDFLDSEPDGSYRVFLNDNKMCQAIKSNGEVTTIVNSTGYIFRRAINLKLSSSTFVPEWVIVDQLDDINTFLLVAQVKGWI